MAGEIKIRLVSELYPQGFNNAVKGMKDVEKAYTETTGKILADAKGSIPKMTKAYKSILESGMEDAPKQAGQYFQNWANALIYNFTGGDSAKLKATLQKAIGEITNIGGEDNLAFINMTSLNEKLRDVASMYDEEATGIESASRRKQAMYEKEIVVLQKLGLESEAYNLTMQNARQQMMALSPSMTGYEIEMERLSNEYKTAQKNLADLTAEQEKATKGGFGQYVGTVVKGMLVHQMVAKAIQTVKQTLKEASQVAGEAEQIYNKLSTVFDNVADSARSMATELSSSIGVAVSTASSALTTVGDLLQAQGLGVAESLEKASDWVQKFQDIINFKDINESLDVFAQNIMAGFLGNTRNLRSIGVVIKDSAVKAELAKRNFDKLTGSELELAKMNIRAEMTFKQLENAMGATEREWDTNLAVNRRLNEAWKEYKENLGDTINSVLKPMKSAWTEILTQVNKANKAQKEFNAGSKNIKVYDIHNNADDYRSFTKDVGVASENARQMYYQRETYLDFLAQIGKSSTDIFKTPAFEEFKKQIILFDATTKDIRELIGDEFADAISDFLKAVEDEKKEAQARVDRLNSLEKANDAFSKLQESLLAITGVNFATSNFDNVINSASEKGGRTNQILGQISDFTSKNIESAIESISQTELSVWGDVVAGELKGLDMAELFGKKMESVAELFTLVWNEYLKDGVIDDEEKATLESIKAIYSDLVDKQKEYADGLERENKIKSSIESMQSNAKNYQTQYEQLGMDADAKAMDDLNRAFDELLSSVGLSGAELDALAQQYEENADKMSEADRQRYENAVKEINKLNNAHSDEIKWLGLLQKAQAENERKEKARNAILEAQNKVIDLQTQISQLYMTDEEKALDDLRIAYEKQIEGMNLTDEESSKLLATYNEQVRTLTTLQSLTKAYNDQLEREENIKGHKESAQDYRTQLNNLGKTEAEITRNNLLEQLYEAQWNGDYDEELVASIKEEIEAFDALQEATAKLEKVENSFADNITNGIFGKYANTGFAKGVGSAIASSTGGQIIQAGIEGGSVGGGWGAIIGVLTAILSKTESFEQILSMVEPVIQMFDNLIKPLVPAIQIISDTLNTLVMAMIRPLLPVFKIIAETIVLISTPIKMIHAIIDNVYIAVHNIVDKLTNWGRDQWGYNSIKDVMNETVASLETIHNLTFDIKENTKKDDARFRAYREMFDKQMITESEYEALIAGIEGIHYDRAKTYNGMAWSNGSGGTTIIYNGDMRFVIEGTNLSADQIAEATIRKQKQLATTGHFF